MFNLLRLRFYKNRRGFTLMELLIASSLIALVIGAVLAVHISGHRSLISANRRAMVQDEARYVMEHMVRNIRLGNQVWVSADGMRCDVTMDWDPVTRRPVNTPADPGDDYYVWYRWYPSTASTPSRIEYDWFPVALWGIHREVIATEIVDPGPGGVNRPLFTIVGGPVRPIFLTIDLTARHDASSPQSIPDNPEVRLHTGVNLRSKSKD